MLESGTELNLGMVCHTFVGVTAKTQHFMVFVTWWENGCASRRVCSLYHFKEGKVWALHSKYELTKLLCAIGCFS